MNRVFAYGRVSTLEQSTDNQLVALQQKGFDIQPHRWFAEQVSGGVPALHRLEFSRMADRMEAGDVLVVLKLDRLGRNVQDVLATIEKLAARKIHVHNLDLDLDLESVDLTSAAGKLQRTVLAIVAAFERDRLRERTKEGLARTSKKGGRSEALETSMAVQACKAKGLTQSQAAAELGISLPTIKRHWDRLKLRSSLAG